MPAQLFPTNNLHWGDVVNVTGPFQGLFQGQVRVKFTGVPWQAPSMQGPFSASVTVPEGAETGECLIEINGSPAFGTQCSIVPRTGAMPGNGPYPEAWKNFGDKSRMGGLGGSMSSYVIQKQSRGAGAIAAQDLGDDSLVARKFAGPLGRPVPWTPGASGRFLPPPHKSVDALIRYPAPKLVNADLVGDRRVMLDEIVKFTESPGAGTVDAGWMKGSVPLTNKTITVAPARYSAVETPGGPSLQRAIAAQHKRYDQAAERDALGAELEVPEITETGTDVKKALFYAGLGVGVLMFLHYMKGRR
jgi:hypothetical protein